MLSRIRDGKLRVCLDDKKYYLDKFVLFNEDKYYFRTFKDQVLFTEIALSIVTKTKLASELKEYMVSLLSALSSLKGLYLDDFSSTEPHYVKTEYLEKIKQVKEVLFEDVIIERPLIEIYEPVEITLELYKVFTKEESYQERKERTEKGEQKPDPETLSYAMDGDTINIVFPEAFSQQYNVYLCGLIENKTGDFYTDLFAEVLSNFSVVKAKLNCSIYTARSITEECVNVEVANAFNYLVQAVVYLRNSSSYRSNKLFGFDLFELDSKKSLASVLIDSAINMEHVVI